MKIDFSQPILGLTGQQLNISETGEALTLQVVATGALLAGHPDDANLGGDEKWRRFKLALEIEKAGEPLEMKAEDAALLKQLIGRMPLPLVVGRAFDLIEGA